MLLQPDDITFSFTTVLTFLKRRETVLNGLIIITINSIFPYTFSSFRGPPTGLGQNRADPAPSGNAAGASEIQNKKNIKKKHSRAAPCPGGAPRPIDPSARACSDLSRFFFSADGSCGRAGKTDAKSYESALTVPNVTSVLLNHRDGPRPEPERSPFQPVSSVLAAQVANAAKRHRAEDGDDDAAARHKQQQQQQQQPAGSKRVPVKIVQDNRAKSTTTGNKPKTEVVAKTAADVSAAKSCAATVSLKQVRRDAVANAATLDAINKKLYNNEKRRRGFVNARKR